MLIQIGLISRERLSEATCVADELAEAVTRGAVSRADELTQRLLALADPADAATLPEELWREFNQCVRREQPGYRTTYLLPPEDCAALLPYAASADLQVLHERLSAAASEGRSLLQLPVSG